MESDHHPRAETIGLDCVLCGHERVVVSDERTVECPGCDESYALVVRDGFALIERDGWIARVAIDRLDERAGAAPG